jgi:hypothetical protein
VDNLKAEQRIADVANMLIEMKYRACCSRKDGWEYVTIDKEKYDKAISLLRGEM